MPLRPDVFNQPPPRRSNASETSLPGIDRAGAQVTAAGHFPAPRRALPVACSPILFSVLLHDQFRSDSTIHVPIRPPAIHSSVLTPNRRQLDLRRLPPARFRPSGPRTAHDPLLTSPDSSGLPPSVLHLACGQNQAIVALLSPPVARGPACQQNLLNAMKPIRTRLPKTASGRSSGGSRRHPGEWRACSSCTPWASVWSGCS